MLVTRDNNHVVRKEKIKKLLDKYQKKEMKHILSLLIEDLLIKNLSVSFQN